MGFEMGTEQIIRFLIVAVCMSYICAYITGDLD